MIICCGTHGSRQRINKKLIQDEYKIWTPAAEAYGYVVQFRSYQGARKGKQVASSTKQGLGENVVLRLMECLTQLLDVLYLWIIFSHIFICLPTSELRTFEQQLCSIKIVYANELSCGTISCKTKEHDKFEQYTSSKKSSVPLTMIG